MPEVIVRDKDGSRARFVITDSEEHPKNDFPTHKVYDETKEPTLRLVTCSGEFDESRGHYRDNLIVFGRRA